MLARRGLLQDASNAGRQVAGRRQLGGDPELQRPAQGSGGRARSHRNHPAAGPRRGHVLAQRRR